MSEWHERQIKMLEVEIIHYQERLKRERRISSSLRLALKKCKGAGA